MNEELQQSVASAAWEKISVAIASALTTLTAGASTYYEILPALLGSLASLVGIIATCVFAHLAIKKNRLERQQLHIQNSILLRKEKERLERAEKRRIEGGPVRREED